MYNNKIWVALMAAPLILIACGDDSSSSPKTEENLFCSMEQTGLINVASTTIQSCFEIANTEENLKDVKEICQDNFINGFEVKAKRVNGCPQNHKKKCVYNDVEGDLTFYFYDKEAEKEDCDNLLKYASMAFGDTYQDYIIIKSFDTKDKAAKDFDDMNDSEKEFETVYKYLDNYYLFAHTDSLVPENSKWYRQLQSRSAYKTSEAYQDIPAEIFDGIKMYSSMEDYFTQYFPPQASTFDEFLDDINSREDDEDEKLDEYGINYKLISTPTGSVKYVYQAYIGSAAQEAGVQQGDTVISESRKGNEVEWEIARNEDGKRVVKKISFTTHSYIKPTVKYEIIDSIAIIHIFDFSNENTALEQGTYGEFVEALKKTEETKATIIDLMNNPGGDANQCQSIAATMAHKNDTIAIILRSFPDKDSHKIVWGTKADIATEDGIASNRYLVFTANSESASCAEYTLMGVTNTRKSPFVGQTTFGKGTEFSIQRSYLNGIAMYTSGLLMDKNQETYHMHGIVPDVEENDPEKTIEIAMNIAKEGTMKRSKGYGENFTENYAALPSALERSAGFQSLPTRKDLGMFTVKDFEKPRNF